jgi:hypothetical protein
VTARANSCFLKPPTKSFVLREDPDQPAPVVRDNVVRDERRSHDNILQPFLPLARCRSDHRGHQRVGWSHPLRRRRPSKTATHLFDPNVLTLGFARRFATYKRPNLLLHDPERLTRLLTNARRPVQLIIAGKAHPEDQAGRAMTQEWTRFTRRSETRRHAIFLSDYDRLLTEHLVQGWMSGSIRHGGRGRRVGQAG